MTNHDIPEASKKVQATTLLAALKEHGPLTTTDGRDHLGICHVAGRVSELRALGYKILTTMVWASSK